MSRQYCSLLRGHRTGAMGTSCWQLLVTLSLLVLTSASASASNITLASQGLVARRQLQRPAPHTRGDGWWTVAGNKFYDSRGMMVRFSGVIWSGFECPEAVAHGLDRRSYRSHLDQMKSLGFNMIRLAFAGETLKSSTYPRGNDITKQNPDLKGLSSLQVMDKIIEAAGRRKMKVILCYHRMRLTIYNEVGTWFDNGIPESVWLNNWGMLAKRYKGRNTIVGADLFNEVHPSRKFPKGAPFWTRNAGKNEKYNFRSASVRAIKRIYQQEPNWIIFLEGMHNGYWWGGNVVELTKAPILQPRGKIAYSTHEYGPAVYKQAWFKTRDFPANLIPLFRKRWGIVQEKAQVPVWVGEFGSFYPPPTTQWNKIERTTFRTLISYMQALKVSWTIAFWNPNSKDTGGILTDDWKTPNWEKLRLLKPIMYPNFI